MHRTIGYLSKRFVQVRPGEGRRVILTFAYFFLIITAYYVIKPASRSLVLGELGSRMVPYVDLICALLMGPIVTLFARLVDRVPKPRLVSYSFAVVIAITLGFWQLLRWNAHWVAGAFYVWVAIFSVLVVTLFWLVANDLYRPREAKRLFGFIGSGGILGGIVGSSIAGLGAHVIGTKQLLLACALLLAACWWVVQQLWALAPERLSAEEPAPRPARHETFLSNLGDFGKLLMGSRYLLLLIALVGLNKLVATLIYYQFNPFIEQAFPVQDARTAFTAFFFGSLNVLAFVIQFFFTSWILRRWGLAVTLIALPAGLLFGTSALLLIPSLWIAAITELYDGSMNYSLQQTTKEVLYLPIDRAIRYKVKPFIDMVVFRFGKGIAAIIGIVMLDMLHVPPRFLSCVAIPLIITWLVVAVRLRRDYIGTIRTMLQARAAARRSRGDTSSTQPGLSIGLGHASAGQKMALVDQLVSSPEGGSAQSRELLEQLRLYEVRATTSLPAGEARQLKAILCDPHEHLARRCQAIQLLIRSADQEVIDTLLGVVILEGDATLRQEAVRALLTLRLRAGPRLDIPIAPIRRQVAFEVANYQRIQAVASICQQHHHEPLAADDPAMALLKALLEESVEQVFRLLMLLYRPEDIHLIYEQLRASDAHLRADALELLDNLVDPAMRTVLFPLLDEDAFLSLSAAGDGVSIHEPTAAFRVLQEAIWDHNYWLSITTLCAVGRLRLTTLRQELEKASRHTMPLVSSAAKVALHLSAHS
ncbi:MAG: hypothetical protein COV75_04535 [Candidatus Omnitrophica bacterium CG11_big_fil_rev_8_21_14_0_20_63_9]|nr:MAG: hypothetical protein COV75_04535 [Candidatus Omnitrophica bacterium CG11_big_fil_rev_8_21_14_0_20_63_9]